TSVRESLDYRNQRSGLLCMGFRYSGVIYNSYMYYAGYVSIYEENKEMIRNVILFGKEPACRSNHETHGGMTWC
ncbi:MAG TPA: hypothetical protein PLT30_14880, partial [Deltaproteobacteria bacterium]|nr:hypothetical protein [Deltaproteobacteria bacterium]